MAKVTIYHNPRCMKSRQTLKLLRDRGIEPEIIEYLKTPPTAAEIRRLLNMLDLQPADLVRRKEHAALGLKDTTSGKELVARMAAHPEIIERPIVVCGKRARLGRPPEAVLEIVD